MPPPVRPFLDVRKGTPMKTVIFNAPDAMFNFSQKEVKEQIIKNQLLYDTDEANKLLSLISTSSNETIMIPDEPVFFDLGIALIPSVTSNTRINLSTSA